jgi:hypothetical protein
MLSLIAFDVPPHIRFFSLFPDYLFLFMDQYTCSVPCCVPPPGSGAPSFVTPLVLQPRSLFRWLASCACLEYLMYLAILHAAVLPPGSQDCLPSAFQFSFRMWKYLWFFLETKCMDLAKNMEPLFEDIFILPPVCSFPAALFSQALLTYILQELDSRVAPLRALMPSFQSGLTKLLTEKYLMFPISFRSCPARPCSPRSSPRACWPTCPRR